MAYDRSNPLYEEATWDPKTGNPIFNPIVGPKRFDGDIIITDPCYIVKDEDWFTPEQEEMKVLPMYAMKAICGFSNYLCNDTLIGDCSCETINDRTGEIIGGFGVDAGLLCVCYLDEVLKYRPDFKEEYMQPKSTLVTLIRDFHGNITIGESEDGVYSVVFSDHANIKFHTRMEGDVKEEDDDEEY